MRRKTQHMVLLLLAFSLLTGSVGMAATQRFCAMLGMAPSTAAFEKMEKMGCCASKKKKPACPEAAAKFEKQACCSTATSYHKLDVSATLKFSKVEFVAIAPALAHTFLLPPVFADAPKTSAWPLYSDSSPPLAGRDLLHRLHILNI